MMADLFRKNNDRITCLLCPHNCNIAPGKTGICGVRKNTGETVRLLTYGVISGYALDPIEKKPLYHFYPGTNILSIGSYGCNLRCDYCQNYNISQNTLEGYPSAVKPGMITRDAQSSVNNIGIAFTYNEPVIWFEFVRDVAQDVKSKGLRTVMVSNGFVNSEPLDEYISFIDAFNIDLKAFNNDFYRKLTGASLEPVREALKQIAGSKRHLEITTLIIPGYNDDEKEMAREAEWIAGELGKDVPLHISRYFPMFRRDDPPTPNNTIKKLYETASAYLNFVYTGNISSDTGQNTKCPGCGAIVVRRNGYSVKVQDLDQEGRCRFCGKQIILYSS